jgi:protein SEY1
VLLFVFRDRTKTPLARLVETWEEDLHRMWAAIPKPPALENTSVTDFFEVLLDALLSIAYKCLVPPL